jgi:hypothetical protein
LRAVKTFIIPVVWWTVVAVSLTLPFRTTLPAVAGCWQRWPFYERRRSVWILRVSACLPFHAHIRYNITGSLAKLQLAFTLLLPLPEFRLPERRHLPGGADVRTIACLPFGEDLLATGLRPLFMCRFTCLFSSTPLPTGFPLLAFEQPQFRHCGSVTLGSAVCTLCTFQDATPLAFVVLVELITFAVYRVITSGGFFWLRLVDGLRTTGAAFSPRLPCVAFCAYSLPVTRVC